MFSYDLLLDLEAMDFLNLAENHGVDSTIFDVQTIIYELNSSGQSKRVKSQLEEPSELARLHKEFNQKLAELSLL